MGHHATAFKVAKVSAYSCSLAGSTRPISRLDPATPTRSTSSSSRGRSASSATARSRGTFLDIRSLVVAAANRACFDGVQSALRLDHLFYVSYTDMDGDFARRPLQPANGVGATRVRRSLLRVNQPYANHNGGLLMFGTTGYSMSGSATAAPEETPRARPEHALAARQAAARVAGPAAGRSRLRPAQPVALLLRLGERRPLDRRRRPGPAGRRSTSGARELDKLANYGWSLVRGHASLLDGDPDPAGLGRDAARLPGARVRPLGRRCSIIGGYVYRGAAMTDEVGRYFYSDLCSGRVWSMAAGGGDNRLENITVNTPSSFGVDAGGELYVASLRRKGLPSRREWSIGSAAASSFFAAPRVALRLRGRECRIWAAFWWRDAYPGLDAYLREGWECVHASEQAQCYRIS